MNDVDEIIERIIGEELAKVPMDTPAEQEELETVQLLAYRCEEHGYDILYDEANQKAIYKFDEQHGTMETVVILAQRNYYVDTQYWILEAKPQGT